jgi:hypothetical protein
VVDVDAVFENAQRPSELRRRWVRRARGLDPGALQDDDHERTPAARRDRPQHLGKAVVLSPRT